MTKETDIDLIRNYLEKMASITKMSKRIINAPHFLNNRKQAKILQENLKENFTLLMEYISEVWVKSEEEFEEFMKDESFENDFMHFMSLLDSKIKVE
ncbi:hypothetical protein [Helicobacter pylori]|uniref:hypothetical protein n=1 Tax=Helicobacter pylori TaxID=210 RepID=UPI0009374766|nr:hypothetical protein [Helicobacter pylori]OJZ93752.1 hypothetical protein AP069_0204915 [Helicobacter pylori]